MKKEKFHNLEKEYDEVVIFIQEYLAFPAKIVKRNANPFRNVFKQYTTVFRAFKVINSINPMSGKSTSSYREYMDLMTDENLKQEEFYRIMTSDYPMDKLGEVIRAKFPHIDFEKLLNAHERRGIVFTGFGMKEVLGFLLAAFTLVLRTIPRTIIENTFHWDYEGFEVTLFFGLLILAGYALIVFLPAWWKLSNARNTYANVGNILKYIVIKYY